MLCGLPSEKSYFQQLCSATGKSLHPSNKVGSVGNIFLNAVKTFFSTSRLIEPCELTSNIDHILCELELDDGPNCEQLGIRRLVLKDNKVIVVSCLKNATEESIRTYLGQNINVDELTIQFMKVELLCFR